MVRPPETRCSLRLEHRAAKELPAHARSATKSGKSIARTDAHELRLEEPPPETARTLVVAQFSGSGGMKHIIIVPAAVRNTQALLRIAGSSSIPGGRLWMMT